MESSKHNNAWFFLAPIGLTLIGFGFSLTGQAIIAKSRKAPLMRWVPLGTIGLIVLNSGVSIFGDAVKRRTLKELAEEAESRRVV